ncbi:MAG: hypothetical protein ACTS6G_00425 [Candidatus Hodgkinia cicadicola]
MIKFKKLLLSVNVFELRRSQINKLIELNRPEVEIKRKEGWNLFNKAGHLRSYVGNFGRLVCERQTEIWNNKLLA